MMIGHEFPMETKNIRHVLPVGKFSELGPIRHCREWRLLPTVQVTRGEKAEWESIDSNRSTLRDMFIAWVDPMNETGILNNDRNACFIVHTWFIVLAVLGID